MIKLGIEILPSPAIHVNASEAGWGQFALRELIENLISDEMEMQPPDNEVYLSKGHAKEILFLASMLEREAAYIRDRVAILALVASGTYRDVNTSE